MLEVGEVMVMVAVWLVGLAWLLFGGLFGFGVWENNK
jgi:hypothetical protein